MQQLSSLEGQHHKYVVVFFCILRYLIAKPTKMRNETTVGSEGELKEKVMSMLHHCSDNHVFPNNKYHKTCSHGDLSKEERNKPWLGEVELNKLRLALVGRDDNRFQDLAKMTGFHHTGDLECFNSLGNKYRAKGYVYG